MIIAQELLGIIARRRFIAEVRTETARQGLYTIEALARGGISVFEISLAIPGADELLRHFSGNTSIFVGAGGVLDARQAHEAARAGATFLVSPIVAPEVIAVCTEHRVAGILSAMTPTEIIAAQRAGADLVNVFPISAVGGSAYLRSLYRQFSALNLMISGGITLENAFEYLALPVRALGLSSTIAPRDLVERGDWNALTHLARQFILATQSGDPANSEPASPSAIPLRAPLLDTMRAPIYQYPQDPAARSPFPNMSEGILPGRDAARSYADAPHPAAPQEVPVVRFGQSSPSLPRIPNAPAASNPRTPAGIPAAPNSTPPVPPPSRPQTPDGKDGFRPWDSKPVGDDWIN